MGIESCPVISFSHQVEEENSVFLEASQDSREKVFQIFWRQKEQYVASENKAVPACRYLILLNGFKAEHDTSLGELPALRLAFNGHHLFETVLQAIGSIPEVSGANIKDCRLPVGRKILEQIRQSGIRFIPYLPEIFALE